MPRGTRHVIEGRLIWTGRHFAIVLADGGQWAVDISPWRARRLLGTEVIVEGVRSGFNLLDVTKYSASTIPSLSLAEANWLRYAPPSHTPSLRGTGQTRSKRRAAL